MNLKILSLVPWQMITGLEVILGISRAPSSAPSKPRGAGEFLGVQAHCTCCCTDVEICMAGVPWHLTSVQSMIEASNEGMVFPLIACVPQECACLIHVQLQ